MSDWSKLKVVDLKAELKQRGLPQYGLKGELIARLEAADEEEPAEDEEPAQDDEVEQSPEVDEQQQQSAVAADNADPGTATAAEEPANPSSKDESLKETTVEKATAVVHENAQEEAAPASRADIPMAEVTADTENLPTYNGYSTEPTATAFFAPITEGSSPRQTPEDDTTISTPAEAQKRKRRSASPPPNDEIVARKRARAEGDMPAEPQVSPAVYSRDESTSENLDRQVNATGDGDQTPMDYDVDVAPALHHATPALYIANLMRPLRPEDIRVHLASLAAAPGAAVDDDVIIDFYVDTIRTHGFVVFDSVSTASRVRTQLHGRVWPNESNRKALWIDFAPPEKISEWIETEESGVHGRSASRWEVIYEKDADGVMEARLESGSASSGRAGPPPVSRPPVSATTDSTNAIPLGPRSQRDFGMPPKGPRATRMGPDAGYRPSSDVFEGDFERTHTKPVISYQLVPEELARRRIDNMRSFYTLDTTRDLGREINRYSFENGDSFVDRGKEVFEGIRPPHRERAVERDRRGGRRGGFSGRGPRRGGGVGGGGFRPRNDRYFPMFGGGGGGRDDRRPRFDSDRAPRFDSDRAPRFDSDRPPRFDNREAFGRDRRY